MSLEPLQQKLLAAARAHPPSDRVPYAFELRIQAHLNALPPVDFAAFWARALWQAAVPCIAVTLVLATWSFAPAPTSSTTEDLSQQFEQTLLAGADQLEESW